MNNHSMYTETTFGPDTGLIQITDDDGKKSAFKIGYEIQSHETGECFFIKRVSQRSVFYADCSGNKGSCQIIHFNSNFRVTGLK